MKGILATCHNVHKVFGLAGALTRTSSAKKVSCV